MSFLYTYAYAAVSLIWCENIKYLSDYKLMVGMKEVGNNPTSTAGLLIAQGRPSQSW